jgi:hypothetical protein
MSTASYESVLQMAQALSLEDKLRLIHEITARDPKNAAHPRRSIVEICGLGAEIWEGIDAQEYVRSERSPWDG